MIPVFGCSAFGFKDCVSRPEKGCTRPDFYLSDAALPQTPFGTIRVGREAKEERIHAGLNWPPEARVQRGQFLRRVPIPYAWRAFVEAGDRTFRWNAGKGVSFPLSRIIASHVAGTLKEEDNGFSANRDTAVVAIPNHLDEFGQEALLRELASCSMRNTILVWRPVAAALAWLDKVGGDFVPQRMGENDHIHVLYLGPDAVEFTTFRLKVWEHDDGLQYVLPLRERPTSLPMLTSIDWAGGLIEKVFDQPDDGAFWQAFTSFPEVWAAIAGLTWNSEELPRPWSVGNDWGFWDPPHDLYEKALSISIGHCFTLREIIRTSCPLRVSKNSEQVESWNDALRKEVGKLARLHEGGRLWGTILCGPLMPNSIPEWLEPELENLTARGLELDGSLDEPELGHLWISPQREDAVAEGAAIYGRQVLDRKPSYLDTMPQISILAQARSRYFWIPLLDAKEVLGGTTYERIIEGRFQLTQGSSKLHGYLLMGPPQDVHSSVEDLYDPMNLPHDELPSCRARLIREVVRGCGSIESVKRMSSFRSESPVARYGLAFAEALYRPDKTSSEEERDDTRENSLNHPFRKVVFRFPSSPDMDMPLDTVVRMRPASGLARVELVPKDPTFLKKRHVFLDYSTMKGASKLPRRQRGWPWAREIPVDLQDSILDQFSCVINRFEAIRPEDDGYVRVLNQVKNMLTKEKQIFFGWRQIDTHVIDQDGHPCTPFGDECIRRVSGKFERDLISLIEAGRRMADLRTILFVRATWLYASTPRVVVRYVKDILSQGGDARIWGWAAEAGSRAFKDVGYYRFLFGAIERYALRTDVNQPFPIQSARAVCRVLMFRRDGYLSLDRDMAELFAQRALGRLYGEQKKLNYQMLFFQLVLMLFYLLRFRKADPNCFDPNTDGGISVFEKTMECLEAAKRYFLANRQILKARRVDRIIDGFKRYLHYEGGEDVVTIIGDFAGDMF